MNRQHCLLLFLLVGTLYAKGCPSSPMTNPQTIGDVLCNIKLNTFKGVFRLIFVFSYVSGFGVLVAAIFKLKQVKDNPTQIPISTPMALFACAALLLFLPSIIVPAGETIFGESSNAKYRVDGNQFTETSNDSVIPDNLLDGR